MRNLIIVFCLIIFISNSNGQSYTKSMYVEHFPQNILGNISRETALLDYAKDRGYTSLILYGMQDIFPITHEQTTTFDYETELISFINRAKNPPYNITEIGVTEGANWAEKYPQPNIVSIINLALLTPTGVATSLGSGDDVISPQINLPFAFNDLDGNPVTKIFASTNGFIELESLQPCISCSTAKYMPNPDVNNPRNIIAGYWSDLNVKTTSVFRYFTNVIGGFRVFVIEWKDVEFKNGGNNGNASFQIQLFEEDKHFEIHIAPGSENPITGSKQTIGISNSTGTIAAGAIDGDPTIYKDRHYPKVGTLNPRAWKFAPSEAHDWIDQNVYWYNNRNPAAKIDLISLEMEFWNVGISLRWEAVQYFQRQLQKTYDIKTAAAPAQKYTIMPYLHRLVDNSWMNDQITSPVSAQTQADFIDSKSDIIGLTYYFDGRFIKQTGLPSYFGKNEALLNRRLELFKNNTYVTKIRTMLSAESEDVNTNNAFFGMDYLDRIQGHTWVDIGGVTHGYDNWYFGNMRTEDKAFLEFQFALSDPDPYRIGPSGSGYPCGGNSTTTLGCTMGAPFGSATYGNILEGVLWLQYGLMPDANFYISGQPYTAVSTNQPRNLTFSDHMPSMTIGAALQSTHKWYKWLYNSVVNSTQYMEIANGIVPVLSITTPHFWSRASYLHQATTIQLNPYFQWYNLRHQQSIRSMFVTVPWPGQIGFRLVDSRPADCPNFNSGSALVELTDDQGNSTATTGIVTWKKGMGSLNSTGTPVPLPFDITNLSDGDWDITIDDGTNTIAETITIDKSPNILPTISPSLSGLSCDPRLTTENYVSYDWKLNGAPVGSTQDFLANQNGTYTVSVIDQRGCSNSSKPYVLEMVPISTLIIESGSTTSNYTEVNIINYNADNTYEWILPPGADGYQRGSKYYVEWNNKFNAGLPISCRITNECNVTSFVSTIPDCVGAHTYQNGSTQTSITNTNFITQSGMVFNGLLKITSNFKFKDCGQVSFGPSAKILVMNGATLTIDNCDFGPSSTCCKMWKGIELEKGSKIIMMNNATISEAEFGLLVNDKSTYTISQSHFRNNYIGIKIGNGIQSVDITGSDISSTEFYSGLFSCSSANYNCFVPPYVGQTTVLGTRPYAGIYIDFCSFVKIGKTPNVLGGDIRFYNLSNGIISHNSNLYVSNTSFKNIALDNAYTPLLGNFNGCGISINGGYVSLKGLGGTYGSDICFENCNYGMVNNKGNCDVSLVASTPDNNTVIYLSDTKKATVTDNCIQGMKYGVFTYHNPDADILIDKNDFRMSTTKNSIACVRTDEFSLGNKIVISNNTMKLNLAAFGIVNYELSAGEIKQNSIEMNNTVNSYGIMVYAGGKNVYKCNSVNALQTYNNPQVGIAVSSSRANELSCNWVNRQQNGINFYGACNDTKLRGNSMNNHDIGLGIYYDGLIGEQKHNGNTWNGTMSSYGAFLSGIDQNLADLNKFYYLSSGTNNYPTVTNDPGYDWFHLDNEGEEFSCSKFECRPTIPREEEGEKPEDGEIAVNSGNSNPVSQATNYFADRFLFEKLKSNSDLLSNNSILQAFFSQQLSGNIGVFSGLDEEIADAVKWETVYALTYSTNTAMIKNATDSINDLDSLLQLDPSNATLKNQMIEINERIKITQESNRLIYETIKQIQDFKNSNALSGNGAVITSEVYEINEAKINEIYLNTVAKGVFSFDSYQTNEIIGIMNQCPYTGGKAVYEARSLYSLIDPEYFWHDNVICALGGTSPRLNGKKVDKVFSVYPNPTTGIINLTYDIEKDQSGEIIVTDALGVKKALVILDHNISEMNINLSNLAPGIYYYSILINSITEKNGVITIIR